MANVKQEYGHFMDERKPIIYWLYTCCFMVFAMAIIGAITRLTESGLSMTEWRPLIGTIPPLTNEEWQRVFDLYRQTSEYQLQHYWMGIDDFKTIFFWEWFHRVWGRLIGLVYGLPLIYFWITKQIPKGYGLKFLGMLILGGMQGVIGWWMVKSGFVDRADVSHYRLATHLGLAFIIFALLLWLAMSLQYERRVGDKPVFCVRRHGWTALVLLGITIIWGAFVAGLNAGMVYNTWPLMNGTFTPQEQFSISGIIENHGWVQFTHRWIAILAAIMIISFAWRIKSWKLGAMTILQVLLGISALLTQLYIPLAAAHQAGALILLALLVQQIHKFYYVHKN